MAGGLTKHPYVVGSKKEIFEATWQFICDHCIFNEETGMMTVKFRTNSKHDFAKRIAARMCGLQRARVPAKHIETIQEKLLLKNAQGDIKRSLATLDNSKPKRSLIQRIKLLFLSINENLT